jgi:hypothetical protein
MSYDFNTGLQACPHTIYGERYVIDTTDFMTLHLASNPALNMRAPINGQEVVQLYISGELASPTPGANNPYAYQILPDENRLNTSAQFYKIVFIKPVRWYVPLIEVSYITLQDYCLRCSATGQLNDFVISPYGTMQRVWDTNKLVQKVLKFVLTSTCPFYPQFTCAIRSYIGKKFGVTITEADISSQIMDALQNIKNIQSAQRTVQSLSLLEMLKDIGNISITMPDPTSVAAQCAVTSYGNQTTPSSVSFSITSSRQLVGNQQ